MERQVYLGGCHCGRVRFEATGLFDRATQCNCSICVAKGYVHHLVAAEDFRLLSGTEDLATYTFGTHVAKHQFCKTCGVAPFFRPRLDPRQYLLNLRCIDGLDLTRVATTPFDGRNWESRLDAPYTGVWGRARQDG